MEKIELTDFIDGPILREKDFRAKVDAHDWTQYEGKRVLIQGCASIPIPTWAYLVVTAHLVPFADKVMYGEQKNRIPIFVKKGEAVAQPEVEPAG